jgi:hypothetical protein
MKNEAAEPGTKVQVKPATLNEFAAACLDTVQKELADTGLVEVAVNFAYGLDGRDETPAISRYVLTCQGTDEEGMEVEKLTNYARKSHAAAVSVVLDMADDPDTLALFSGCDGLLLVAAVSSSGSVTIMRPYRRTGGRIVFADPTVTDRFPIPAFEGLFASFGCARSL